MSTMPDATMATILIAAGGTGGHVYPALAIAQKLRATGNRVVWLGVRHGLEAEVVPQVGIELCFVSVVGLRRRGLSPWLLAPFRLARALLQALSVVWRLKPQAVLGMGGFASGPGAVAAWLLRRPLLIHEQNAVPGLTNRLLSKIADVILESFPDSFPPQCKAIRTGNPLREEILKVEAPATRLAGRNGPLRVLVLGGSLGAQSLNEVVPQALKQLPDSVQVDVRHQTGRRHLAATVELYESLGLRIVPDAYIEGIGEAYAWADLAVCRAGAMTVSELAAAGVPAILVPFPYAVDDHQTLNARYLAQAGGAVLLPEHQLEPQGLSRLLADFHDARDRLASMANKARACALRDASSDIAELCLEAANA
jgi:UDP-N-acetylglucosamine--N-acetylmuramyl-(pentapeptide) pyrophosphoryl-undecaprenol N-acetylglucosamine transferase